MSLGINLTAQQDPEAIKILDEFSRKASSAPSVSIDFRITTSDAKDGSTTTFDGSAIIKGDKYRLTLPENSVWADGKTLWSYLPDMNEVTITVTDTDDRSFLANPSLLFTMYREGFKVRLIDQTPKEWIIDLYPEEIQQNLMRIRLKIGKASYALNSAEYKTKDGVAVTLEATRYDLTAKPGNEVFTFNPSSYKGLEIIDMR